ncbi:MAG: hypothetical protein ACTSRZ_19040 [Promethearchaeota archaeon]
MKSEKTMKLIYKNFAEKIELSDEEKKMPKLKQEQGMKMAFLTKIIYISSPLIFK